MIFICHLLCFIFKFVRNIRLPIHATLQVDCPISLKPFYLYFFLKNVSTFCRCVRNDCHMTITIELLKRNGKTYLTSAVCMYLLLITISGSTVNKRLLGPKVFFPFLYIFSLNSARPYKISSANKHSVHNYRYSKITRRGSLIGSSPSATEVHHYTKSTNLRHTPLHRRNF